MSLTGKDLATRLSQLVDIPKDVSRKPDRSRLLSDRLLHRLP